MTITAKQAAEILAGVAKANGDEVRSAILKVLSRLESADMTPFALFDIAEQLRPRVDYVVFEYRAAYADRALPLGDEESRRFGNAIGLLDHLEALYRRVHDEISAAPATPATPAQRAHTIQRCVAAMVTQMIEHYRARQTVEAGLWHRLQRHMLTASAEKFDRTRVQDAFDPSGACTPAGAYGRALLLSIAQAGAMAQRNLEATLALTAQFAEQLDWSLLEDAPKPAAAASGGVGIKRTGRIRIVSAGGVTHLVNTTKVDGVLGRILGEMAAGKTADQLGLGHVGNADLANLMPRLRRIWCGAGEIREIERLPLREVARVGLGFLGISKFANAGALKPPKEFEIWDYRRGSQSDGKTDVVLEADRDLPPEKWKVRDHSDAGMRAKRHGKGARLRRHQLLAVEFDGHAKGRGFTLGEFRWLQQHVDAEGGISAGVRFLTKHATVALVRIHGLQHGQYQSVGPAFVIVERPNVSLVLPYGWYAAKRDADLWHDDQIVPVRLTELRTRGADYEIVGIEPREVRPGP